MSNLTSSHHGNATLIQKPDLCTKSTCDISLGQVQYYPNLAGNSLFLAIFAFLIVLQLGLGYRHKTWSFAITTICGLILEVIGYLGRILLHNNPFDHNAFLIELICLTIAPAFLTASLYLCLGRIVVVYGSSNSRFAPRTYTVIFCACDLFSLVLQAIGGAIAATADTGSKGTTNGEHIMVAGLAFQVFSLLLFAVFCAEFAWRVRGRKGVRNETFLGLTGSRRFKGFLLALITAGVTIFVRCVFRVAELQGGFRGRLANEQVTFMILEGTMIIIAEISMTLFHPGISFQDEWLNANFPWRKTSASASTRAEKMSGTPEYQASAASERDSEMYRGRNEA